MSRQLKKWKTFKTTSKSQQNNDFYKQIICQIIGSIAGTLLLELMKKLFGL